MDKIPEKVKVVKYGSNRKSVPIPRSIEDEIDVGAECEVIVDRKLKGLLYLFPNSDIKGPEELTETVKEAIS